MKPRTQNALLVVATCLATVFVFELAARPLVSRREGASDVFLGVPLPPIRVVGRPQDEEMPRDAPYKGIVVRGQRITLGDLAGYHRHDPQLGYVPQENARSVNGWWQSNNIGAREADATTPQAAPGIRRLLLIGESFANGSGVPGDEAWASVLERSSPGLEIVNLAVDGYGMGQAVLRYESFRDSLEHHGVLLMFVPSVDLWRDINTLRNLGEPWDLSIVMPRFTLEADRLHLVHSPYAQPADVYSDNAGGLSRSLRDHLRTYDRFYFRPVYEPTPVLGRLLSYRIGAAAYGRVARYSVWHGVLDVDSEAMRVTHALFLQMAEELRRRRKEFHLLILPTAHDVAGIAGRSRYARRWQGMVDSMCAGIDSCTDLSPALMSLRGEQLDTGHDGHHYGPIANEAIARAVSGIVAR